MIDLTDKQKAECQEIIEKVIDFWWSKLIIKMEIEGKPYELALQELLEEIKNDN